MKRYSDSLVQQARNIRRKDKYSYTQIGHILHVPSETIRNWCYGIDHSKYDTILAAHEIKRNEYRMSETGVVPNFEKISESEAKFFAALLYGCEGSKYPNSIGISFSNSDPGLVTTFLKLLRKGFKLDESRFRIHLQAHTNHNYETLRQFWSKLLVIPESKFMKPTVKTPSGGKHRENYVGTCSLRYGDYRLQLRLQGIFEEFVKRLGS